MIGKRAITVIVAAVLAIWCVPPVSAYAQVTATENAYGDAGTVYVAGNPDFYPVEYYDPDSRGYKGMMPDLLEKISTECGVDFVYIQAGTKDLRQSAAQNKQVELLSGCVAEEDIGAGVTASASVLILDMEGQNVHICFGYTDIASLELRKTIDGYLSAVGADEAAGLAVLSAMQNGREPFPFWIKTAAVVSLVLLLVLVVLTVCFMHGRKNREHDDGMTDRTTGVGNRNYFVHYYGSLVTDSTRPLYYIFYLCFDISRVNSYYGADESENILRYAADVLSGYMADSDFFGRISGGGFAAACQCINHNKAEEWINFVLEKINGYGKKFGKDYVPEFRAGIYKLKKDDASCETALYAAQQGYQLALAKMLPYSFAEENDIAILQETEELRKQAIHAISAHEFKCYLQYIVDCKTERVFAAEVLSRWHHPERGLLMPGKYIADMEGNDTITELDYYMVEEVCRILEKLQDEEMEEICLFCNISRRTFSQQDFSEKIAVIAGRYSFNHEKLYLEVTESSMFQNGEVAERNILKCKKAGFQIALDDVGSGYSSFSDLIQYPVDVVKFDREILLSASQENGKKLMNGMNALFHYIGVKTLCEGVETQNQFNLAVHFGLDLVQGFYIQKPLPTNEAIRLLKEKLTLK